MSDSICGCSHSFDEHDFKKNENNEMKRPCTKCSTCDHFRRIGAQSGAENRVREKNDKEQARKKAEEDENRKAEELVRKKEQNRYQRVFHICDIKNLESIIEKGLFSRVLAEMKCPGFVSIANTEIVNNRRSGNNDRPNWTTFASTYFEPINAMYYAVRRQYETVIVEFELDLSKPGIVITDGNAATGRPTVTNFHHSNFVGIMESLKKLWQVRYRGPDNFESTDEFQEQRRIYQAECLVPDNISQDCIKSIQIAGETNYRDTISHVDDLIAKSGLSIKRKIMYYSPPKVRRE